MVSFGAIRYHLGVIWDHFENFVIFRIVFIEDLQVIDQKKQSQKPGRIKWWLWSFFTHFPLADLTHTLYFCSSKELNKSIKYEPDRPMGSVWKVTKTTNFFTRKSAIFKRLVSTEPFFCFNFWDCFFSDPGKSSKILKIWKKNDIFGGHAQVNKGQKNPKSVKLT